MKAYFKKIAALSAAALLVLSMAACGGNDDEDTTGSDAANSNAVVEDMPADNTNASEDASAASEDASAASENASEAASNGADSNTPSASTPSANATSLSKEEAVALFNKASASAKSMAGKRYTAVNLIEVPGGDMLKGVISGALPSADEATAIKGVPNTTMQASDFSSVTAKKSGSNWVITMNLKTETAPNNAANARAFEELPQDQIDEWINGKLSVKPSNGVKFVYSGGSIVATVSADGSKLVSATYTMKVNVSVTNVKAMGIVSISSAKVSVTQTDKF